MSDNFQIKISKMVVFDSRWLDPEDPLYIKYKRKLVRNPEPPEYFIDTLPPDFVVNGFAEMGFDGIVSWLKRVFDKDIIIPVQMSALLYKAKADTLTKLHKMEWSDAVGNGLRCLILDIWAEGIITATKEINTIVLQDWEYFINREFYDTFKDKYFSAEGLDEWELFKVVKWWYEQMNERSQDSVLD